MSQKGEIRRSRGRPDRFRQSKIRANAVSGYTETLVRLCEELFSPTHLRRLQEVSATDPLDVDAIVSFDDSFPGPSLSRIADERFNAPGTLGIPGHGITRCEVEDRATFRPLHYCMVDLTSEEMGELAWRAREVVEMSGLHLESLLKRIGHEPFLPLGDILLRRLKPQVDQETWQQLSLFKEVHTDAKHRFDHQLGTHLFSVQEAVLAYFVARRLGQKLYPLANLKSDWRFERACRRSRN